MQVKQCTFNSLISRLERHNRGWLSYENIPEPIAVFINGKSYNHVVAVNRKKGKALVAHHPFRVDKYRKRFLSRMVYGDIRLERLSS